MESETQAHIMPWHPVEGLYSPTGQFFLVVAAHCHDEDFEELCGLIVYDDIDAVWAGIATCLECYMQVQYTLTDPDFITGAADAFATA